ncbi:uncharacterized protein STEHIDRAFT_155621 [Stereum hirsutum FP-91666 SS1]|uniref:uncharacterized protein n=1 Tax=Stereum hirsutum (strain FP-91666) TaxID=721885 RepID=UPI000440C887|nr:uncharacterized protein STEHIDRAFT_155621 [Stereum hirsutum FP-91666 SS1]EIM88267.1 hypothetical protein STEHIDRAFT_155621 [Stereum hirsutum FP-91666 SS1]
MHLNPTKESGNASRSCIDMDGFDYWVAAETYAPRRFQTPTGPEAYTASPGTFKCTRIKNASINITIFINHHQQLNATTTTTRAVGFRSKETSSARIWFVSLLLLQNPNHIPHVDVHKTFQLSLSSLLDDEAHVPWPVPPVHIPGFGTLVPVPSSSYSSTITSTSPEVQSHYAQHILILATVNLCAANPKLQSLL